MVYTDGTALVGDTVEELHTFAQKAGVFTFYDHRRRPHYIVNKTELPTVMAHGAKRVKTSALATLSNTMAKKRDLWWKDATDEQLREKIQTYAPWKRGEMIYYEGQEFTQQEMFDIWFAMFKDLQEGKDVSAYKLPKVLPLNPRRDPPTDRDILADLYNKIDAGKDILKKEYEAAERNDERIEMVKAKMAELQDEYDPLELKVQKDAIAELEAAFRKTDDEYRIIEDTHSEEAKAKRTALSNMNVQLQALNERLVEIQTAQAPREQERAERSKEHLRNLNMEYIKEETTEEQKIKIHTEFREALQNHDSRFGGLHDRDWYHAMLFGMDMDEKTLYGKLEGSENLEQMIERKKNEREESVKEMEENEELLMFGDQDMTPKLSDEQYAEMLEAVQRDVTKAAVENSLDKFLELYPQYTRVDYYNFIANVTGSAPFPVEEIKERIDELENTPLLPREMEPPPGMAWLGDRLITLHQMEEIDPMIRERFSEHHIQEDFEKYTKKEPVIVPADMSADEANNLYGDEYGSNWKYPPGEKDDDMQAQLDYEDSLPDNGNEIQLP